MSHPTIAIDRIEGARAVLDIGGETVEIPAAALPPGATEGCLLTLKLSTDTAAALDAAAARIERLAQTDLPDDIQL